MTFLYPKAFNDLITERRILLDADNQFTYGGCTVKEGTFEINFNQQYPGTNIDYACSEISKQFDLGMLFVGFVWFWKFLISTAGLFDKSRYSLPIIAKRSIRDDWDSKKEGLLAKFKEELLGADVTLNADYEALWKVLVDGKEVRVHGKSPLVDHTYYFYSEKQGC